MLDWRLYLPPTRFAILLLPPLCSLCDDILYCDGVASFVNVGESPNASSERRRMSAIVEASNRNEADLTIVLYIIFIAIGCFTH